MYKADRVVLSANYLVWKNLPENVSLEGVNRGFYLGYFIDNPFGGSRFSVAFGASLSSDNLYSDAVPTFILSGSYSTADFIKIKDICSLTPDYSKNKLSFNYISIPVELRLRLGKDEYWKISAGFEAGYLLSSVVKYQGNNILLKNSDKIKIKFYNIENAYQWRYGVSFRIGYNRFGLRLFYPFTTIFTKNSQQNLFPIELGLTLMVF